MALNNLPPSLGFGFSLHTPTSLTSLSTFKYNDMLTALDSWPKKGSLGCPCCHKEDNFPLESGYFVITRDGEESDNYTIDSNLAGS